MYIYIYIHYPALMFIIFVKIQYYATQLLISNIYVITCLRELFVFTKK